MLSTSVEHLNGRSGGHTHIYTNIDVYIYTHTHFPPCISSCCAKGSRGWDAEPGGVNGIPLVDPSQLINTPINLSKLGDRLFGGLADAGDLAP